MQVNIEIDREYVIIEGVRVARSAGMSPSQWMDWWAAAREAKEDRDELEELRVEADDLKEDVSDLKRELTEVNH